MLVSVLIIYDATFPDSFISIGTYSLAPVRSRGIGHGTTEAVANEDGIAATCNFIIDVGCAHKLIQLVNEALVHELPVVVLNPNGTEDVVRPVGTIIRTTEGKHAVPLQVAGLALEPAHPGHCVDARGRGVHVLRSIAGVCVSKLAVGLFAVELLFAAVKLANEVNGLGVHVVLIRPLLLGNLSVGRGNRLVVVLLEVHGCAKRLEKGAGDEDEMDGGVQYSRLSKWARKAKKK